MRPRRHRRIRRIANAAVAVREPCRKESADIQMLPPDPRTERREDINCRWRRQVPLTFKCDDDQVMATPL